MKNSKNLSLTDTLQSFSFKRGYNQIKRRDLPAIQKELMEALRISNRTSFYLRLNGKIEPKISDVHVIEKIFRSYGVLDVWGNE